MKPVALTAARIFAFEKPSSNAPGAGVVALVVPPLKRMSRTQAA